MKVEVGQIIRVLTLTQPWATLVALGAKRIETRSWGTGYRGPLAIHAARGFCHWDQDLCCTSPFREALLPLYPQIGEVPTGKLLPLGCIVAVARLCAVVPIDENHAEHYGPMPGFDGGRESAPWIVPPPTADPEHAFGHYAEGRRAWLLDDVSAIDEPIPHKGAQGLRTFQWPANNPDDHRA